MKFILKDIEEGTFNSGNPITISNLFRLDNESSQSVGDSITNQDIINWDSAFSWGNHSTAGYLKTLPAHNHDTLYAPISHSHAWTAITGKPTTFPPSAHTHDYDKYVRWYAGVGDGTYENINSGSTLNFVGSGATTVTRLGSTITISSTDNTGTGGDGNNYPTSLGFSTTTGVLTIARNGTTSITTDLDGRYLELSGGTLTGNLTAPAFYESSLRKFKENIQPFNGSGLFLINQLDIVTFDRKNSKIIDKIGVIADDTPGEFLSTDKDAVDLYKTTFIQAKAIQELSEKVEKLEAIIEKVTGNG